MTKYLVLFERTSTGYSAYVPDLPGCVASAENKQLTEDLIYEAIQMHIEEIKRRRLRNSASNN